MHLSQWKNCVTLNLAIIIIKNNNITNLFHLRSLLCDINTQCHKTFIQTQALTYFVSGNLEAFAMLKEGGGVGMPKF